MAILMLVVCSIYAQADPRATSVTINISLQIEPDPTVQQAKIEACASPRSESKAAGTVSCDIDGHVFVARREERTVRMIAI